MMIKRKSIGVFVVGLILVSVFGAGFGAVAEDNDGNMDGAKLKK